MKLTLPTHLTIFRIILIPIFVILFYLPDFLYSRQLAAAVVILASVTDGIDGFLARKLNQTSKLGAFLDPVADKLLVVVALVLLVQYYKTWFITIPAMIMIMREVLISALRQWMTMIGQQTSIAVSILGKVKTIFQMVAICGMVWRPTPDLEILAIVLFYCATAITVWSMWQYIKASQSVLKEQK